MINFRAMPNRRSEDLEEDPDGPDEWDIDDDEEDGDTIECPHCGAEISEYAQQCPRCRYFVSEEQTRRAGQPKWGVITAIVILAMFVYAAIRWFF
jgi:predicted nucleic acid-binding Zn ribbon protein